MTSGTRTKRRGKTIELAEFSSQEQLTAPQPAAISSSRTSQHMNEDLEDEDDVAAFGNSLERTATAVTSRSQSRTAAVIASVTLITAISTLLNGLTTVALPTMASDLAIADNILFWPLSIQALICGCTLLISGAIADALGPRFMYIVGSVLQSGFVLACGLSQTAAQLIAFRGLSGIAISLCLPSAVSIITSTFEGKRRDFAFASMGGGQPVGFSIGLALGGVLTDHIGWRWGFYISAIFNTVVLGFAVWALPKEIDDASDVEGQKPTWKERFQRLIREVDWIGVVLASTSLAMLSYVLASITGSQSDIKQPANIALLATAVAMIPAFIFWVGRQERLGKPAIIPNSLWKNRSFTFITLAVFLTWSSFNSLETILTFYFQKVQSLSATQASIRFLPAPVSGAISNLAIGLLVHRVRADWLVMIGCVISLAAPLCMAFATPTSSYWASGFLANVFNPTGADSLFTISNLVITSVFPTRTQALAGGVFNTISQIGKSVGLALVAVIAADVTGKSSYVDKTSPDALMEGYRATFWYCFATILSTCVLIGLGLRNIGKVGHKQE
ncbi:hypothetical protein AMS68_001118 [Peltaster fructicola]|uniref:Major facilitator superfamily (MFS) profile domain-containing protein n=1 Tax=Peltaster fructicola TaxID=286661 RepID=A0A6H0XLT5_9PEZI|nr:hypothetical protein AMS68_001118 [Peltaster fructicola]